MGISYYSASLNIEQIMSESEVNGMLLGHILSAKSKSSEIILCKVNQQRPVFRAIDLFFFVLQFVVFS